VYTSDSVKQWQDTLEKHKGEEALEANSRANQPWEQNVLFEGSLGHRNIRKEIKKSLD
jgi:hypothetical protein